MSSDPIGGLISNLYQHNTGEAVVQRFDSTCHGIKALRKELPRVLKDRWNQTTFTDGDIARMAADTRFSDAARVGAKALSSTGQGLGVSIGQPESAVRAMGDGKLSVGELESSIRDQRDDRASVAQNSEALADAENFQLSWKLIKGFEDVCKSTTSLMQSIASTASRID